MTGLKYLTGLAACALTASALTVMSYAAETNYITEVNIYANIGWNSSTDFSVELSYDDEDDREYIESCMISDLASTSTKVQVFEMVFSSNEGNGYLFAEGDSLTINATNVETIGKTEVTKNGRKLTVVLYVRYKSSGTKTTTAATHASTETGPTITEIVEGWSGSGDNWYYIRSDGTYYQGWINDGTGWYYCNPAKKGKMSVGWVTVEKQYRYYFSKDHDGTFGRMLTGWQTIDGSTYYLRPDNSDGCPEGSAVAGATVTIDGTEYTFDFSGKLVTETT